MKKILGPVGKVFGAIWRWIKETAWVQPLLIVGLIFGLIFSIQPVSKWISGIAESISNNEKIYKKNKVSLINNRAYDLIMKDEERFATDEKYFLVFVEESCANCKEAYPAFVKLFNDKTFNDITYKMKTIYVDEDGETGADATTYKNNAFFKLYFNNDVYRETIADVAKNSSYFLNGKIQEDQINTIQTGTDFFTPLVLLMDKATFEADATTMGIKEVMIGVAGSTPTEKAQLLEDCWLTQKDFK